MYSYTLGDPDYFTPLERTLHVDDPSTMYSAADMPESWARKPLNVWVSWTPPNCVLPGQGWKVHVAARLDDARAVLDIVARVCREEGVAFKHLASERIFLWMHHKHGPRSQSGKFCASYPVSVEAARRLMERLRTELAGYEGAYALTDRRYRDSRVVSYRYGGFTHPARVQPDGSHQPMLVDGTGEEVPDPRPASFVLPAGIEDPFGLSQEDSAGADVAINGYEFAAVLRHANGGGAYRANRAGRTVFIKEARGNNGYHWDRSTAVERLRDEHTILTELHAAVPGICPEPLDYFTYWEHEFLVTEFISGISLWSWMVLNNPLITVDPPADVVRAYFVECERIIEALRTRLGRMHDAGYCFGDLNPHNVLLVDGEPRLIDFEAAGSIDGKRHAIGADGYRSPDAAKQDGRHADEYALSAIAQMLISPLHPVLTRNPDGAAHLLADAGQIGPVSPTLWGIASRYRSWTTRPDLPTPQEVADDPSTHLKALRDATVDGLLAMARERKRYPDDPPFPTSTWGWATNRLCVAHGTAGVLHALRVSGEQIDPMLTSDLRRAALDDRDELPPGLLTGLAGIAWVLADLGHLDEAAELIGVAIRHPITTGNATLGEGAAGVATALLALYGHTHHDRWLREAHRLLAELPAEITAGLGQRETTGWQRGRTGIAQSLFYAGELCAEPEFLHRGLALLREELDNAVPGTGGGLLYRVSARGRRIEPYLATGSAGFALVAGRYLTRFTDETLSTACRESLRSCDVPMSVSAGLFTGTAGLGFALADRGLRAEAYRVGRGMFKYAVPFGAGRVRYLSGIDTRYRADLAGGSAGVLIFLAKLLSDVPDAIFTLDGLLPAHANQLAAHQPA